MPSRPTASTRKNAEDNRDGFLRVARALVAAVAGRCQAGAGSYFGSRDRLLAEAFRSAASHEVDRVRQAVAGSGRDARHRLGELIRIFCGRALRGRRMAWALPVEPAGPMAEAERLVYRRCHTDLGEQIIRDGPATRIFQAPGARPASSAVMGAVSEAPAGWIRPQPSPEGQENVIEGIRASCFRALGVSIAGGAS